MLIWSFWPREATSGFNVNFFFSTSHSKISIIFIYEIIIVSRKSEVTCRESQKYLKERKYALRLKNYETNGAFTLLIHLSRSAHPNRSWLRNNQEVLIWSFWPREATSGFNVNFFFSTSHSKISIIFIYEIIIVSRKSEVTCRESQKYLKERKYALRLKNYETNGCIYTPSWA